MKIRILNYLLFMRPISLEITDSKLISREVSSDGVYVLCVIIFALLSFFGFYMSQVVYDVVIEKHAKDGISDSVAWAALLALFLISSLGMMCIMIAYLTRLLLCVSLFMYTSVRSLEIQIKIRFIPQIIFFRLRIDGIYNKDGKISIFSNTANPELNLVKVTSTKIESHDHFLAFCV